jgi:oligopeptide transport system substrate-binding protein
VTPHPCHTVTVELDGWGRRGPRATLWLMAALVLGGCQPSACNSPYSKTDEREAIIYSSFSERPKHLDPVRAYVVNESEILGQVYEPPLQYPFPKRPDQVIPHPAKEVPQPVYLDENGERLPQNAPADRVAHSLYEIRIQPGIEYQPHPAFAQDAQGRYRYHNLSFDDLSGIHGLADFTHTGSRELVAADYVYQLKRMAHPKLHCPIASMMGKYIVGLTEYSKTLSRALERQSAQGTAHSSYVDLRRYRHPGVHVVDRYTYRITVRGKYPQFVYWLAMPFFAPVPWEAERFHSQPGMAERNITLDWYPVGTGPFMLVENNPNRRMVLVKNPNFHGERYPDEGEPGDRARGLLEDAGKPLPLVDKAIYSLEKESIPYWTKFLQGYYDTSGISSDSFDQAIRFNTYGDMHLSDELRAKGIQLITAVTTTVWFWGFNMKDKVVGAPGERGRKLRRAISIGIDMEEMISIFYNGRGIPAHDPIPPGIFGHVGGERGLNRHVYDWADGQPRRKSVKEARRLLAEAGYPNGRDAVTGRPLLIYFDTAATGPDSKARLDWIRKQFAKLDINLVIRTSDFNRFQDKVRKGTWQLLFWGWGADYPDPENFLFLLYGPNGKVDHGGENHVNYDSPEYNHLFERMQNMDNGPERQAIIDRMVAILRRDAPWAWGFFPKGFTLHHAWYKNAKPNLMSNNALKYKRVDPLMRARKRAEWNRPLLWPLALMGLLVALSIVPAIVAIRRRERMTAR